MTNLKNPRTTTQNSNAPKASQWGLVSVTPSILGSVHNVERVFLGFEIVFGPIWCVEGELGLWRIRGVGGERKLLGR